MPRLCQDGAETSIHRKAHVECPACGVWFAPVFAPECGSSASVGWQAAPVIIAVCGDLRTYLATVTTAYYFNGDGGPNATYLMNIGNATHIIFQAAYALGLGASWVSTETPWEWRAKELLKVPPELTIHEFVPIGYRSSKAPTPYRRALEDIVHYEEYDQSKFRSDEDILAFVRKIRKKTKPAYSDYWVE